MSDIESDFEYEDDFEGSEDGLYESEDDSQSLVPTQEDNYLRGEYNNLEYYPWTIKPFIRYNFQDKIASVRNHIPLATVDEALILLQYKKWQPDEVINAYFDKPQELLNACGLPAIGTSNNQFETVKKFECSICCEKFRTTRVYSLTCKHKYCLDCYMRYIQSSIQSGNLIKCMSTKCSYVVPHSDIDKIIGNKEENQLLLAHARAFIDASSKFKWCPSTDCQGFTEIIKSNGYESDLDSSDISKVPIVSCVDRHEFCFNCNYENHLPCPCWIVKLWIKKCQDDSETANWIEANTHSCPKCDSSIEKNGGCNHMTCKKCSHQFCWICLGSWKEHNRDYFKCNKFKESKSIEERKNKSKLSLQRYLHFYKRFAIHESSMKGDLRTLAIIHEITRMYMEKRKNQEQNLSWNDIQFLPDAIRGLIVGRKTLKWTYCFAYYLSKSNFAQIFESNQDFLNKTVEDLSELFEKLISKDNKDNVVDIILKEKNKIINLSELIMTRKRTLVSGTILNVQQDLLRFEA
ncbi:uncharacterized protein RJT21DRAFT_121936 [Scheffersomyces amazonensis]|uniref:uncharacterized protein n=1 Tax=Scheffersomyces amazonensis TaxID=1078765 RepID=UPI00315D3D39